LSKTKVLIFNKPGNFLKESFYLDKEAIECVNKCKYLGIVFTSSGLFQQGKEELLKESLKAKFKLQKSMSACNPSIDTAIHLYDHTIKPIYYIVVKCGVHLKLTLLLARKKVIIYLN